MSTFDGEEETEEENTEDDDGLSSVPISQISDIEE